MQILAFTGRKGHGKDSAAAPILELRHPKTCKSIWAHVNFADTVKDVCAVVFDMDFQELFDPAVKELKMDKYPFESPRSIMQKVGTDLFRNQWADVWVKVWEREAKKHNYVVVTDLRFKNEYDAVKRLWGTVVRIERPGMDDSDEHRSETEMTSFKEDILIKNDGDFETLDRRVLEIPLIKEMVE